MCPGHSGACQTAYGKTIEYTTDIAVVGGGAVGLSAAVTGAEAGAKVIVVEKILTWGKL
ncbi:FAD-binding protein [Shewanella dokdonensis]|uniref:FAD-binding protein n=1 Tax=Shewanella dokdonensis TaxID=712036 RepID=A0ABX8DIY8_9GAMM|nr:FAD-binding protein [Shewanella dokdonensis]